MSAGVLVAFALVAVSWLLPRTRRHHHDRIATGVAGCLLAFFYGKAVMAVSFAIGIALWLKYGD
ncbi:hypothetical protein ABZ865_16335 [Streptomyces sp. NPDC047085]|uniref:hypothetical protein n=1 Tax=Streptomyces sp. NPDC047085 TaxID=3155140 RepID=UPI0033D7A1E5